MIGVLETLGMRMLNRIVPKATAQATQCACDPGCWCSSLASRCCCNANCQSITCYCPIGGCR